MGLAYLAIAWLLIQVADTVLPNFSAPSWVMQALIFSTALGLPVALLLSWFYEYTSDGIKAASESSTTETVRFTGRKIDFAIIGLLILAVGYLLVEPFDDEGTPSISDSIAVLPFDDLSPDPENAFYAQGIHAEIITQLQKIQNLSVISRDSVMVYAGSKPALADIAADLGVQSLLTGNFQFANGQIRLAVSLVDPLTSSIMWGGDYQENFEDIFVVQADIAMNVANSLAVEFSLTEQAALEQEQTADVAAYALYLEAQDYWLSSSGEFDEINEATHALLDRALSIDPNFARALGLKALTYSNLLNSNVYGAGATGEERAAIEAQIEELAGRALMIDPNEANARQALRAPLIVDWRWTEYAASFTARELETLTARHLWVFAWMGNIDEAIRYAQRIVDVDPNQAFAYNQLGLLYIYSRQTESAEEALVEAANRAPALPLIYLFMAVNAISADQFDQGLHHLRRTEQLLADNRVTVYLPELAYAYSLTNRSDDVNRIYSELALRGGVDELGVGTWAMTELAAGNESRALELLERAAQKATNHEPDLGLLHLMNLRMNFLNDARLEESEFADVLDRIRGD